MTEIEARPGALAGLRVVEACEGVAGPYAAMLLAEQGADVVKIEPPSGDRLRGRPAFHALNRSKRSIVLDLEAQSGRATLLRLLQVSDLLLHDWPPGRAERLGLTADVLRAANPRLLLGWLPAYGGRGRWAHLPPDEALVQAVAGVSAAQYRYEPAPVYVNTPVAGYAQAIVGAIAAGATVYAAARGAAPDQFEVSGVAGVFAFETTAYMHGSGTVWRSGQQDPRGPLATYRLVQGSDGEWLFCGALTPPFWTKLALALGLDECLLDERFANAPMGITDPAVRDELKAKVDTAFLARPRDDWLRILEQHDVPRAPAGTREEYARDPQTAHNRMMIDVDDPALGRTRQPNVPVWLRESPGRVRAPAPLLGSADLHHVLRDYAAARDEAVRDGAPRRFPLEDVVVLDLGGFIAGANGSMMLSDLGADVIKIEPPEGDGWRASGLAFFGSNRGKRGLCIDLKHPDGHALFLDLVDRADVVLDNMRAGVMDRLGIGYDALRARNPRIIHTSVTGYGPSGPCAHLPGFDPLMQARSGIMRAQGEPGGEPVFLQMPVCDYMTALLAAYGTVCALVARERTGRGDRVETSLANSAFAVQQGEFIFYDGRPPDPPGGRDLAGRHALYRVYATASGYVMIACRTDEQAAAVLRALDLPPAGAPLAQPLHGKMSQRIAEAFLGRPAGEWLDLMLPLGVPLAPCTQFSQLFDDEHVAANGLWWEFEHEQWGTIRQTGAVVRWDAMSMHLPRPAPRIGEHSVECLRDLGVAAARIDSLLASGVVRQAPA